MEDAQSHDILSQYPATLAPDATLEARTRWMESQLELYELALNAINDGVVVTDHTGIMTYANPAAATIFACPVQSMIGERVLRWIEDVENETPIAEVVDRGESVRNRRVLVRGGDGRRVSVLLSVTPMFLHGRIVRVIGLFRDLTEVERMNEGLRKALEAASRLARTDEKTGLLNERAYRERLERVIGLARRRGEALGVVLIDSNGLKRVNDTCGYEAGDCVIREIGKAIKRTLYDTDTIARLHGDEFALILPMTSKILSVGEQLRCVMEKLARALTFMLPLPIVEGTIPTVADVSVSMGAVVREGERILDVDGFLRFATHALHESKRRSRMAAGDLKSMYEIASHDK